MFGTATSGVGRCGETSAMAAEEKGERRSGRSRRCAIVGAILLTVYLGSYLAMSRVAFRQADRANAEGFYFFVPLTPASRRRQWTIADALGRKAPGGPRSWRPTKCPSQVACLNG